MLIASFSRLAWRPLWAVLTAWAAALALNAQTPSALDGFEPDFDGNVYAAVTQGDGRVIVGGQFTAFRTRDGALITRNNLARLNVDGSLDDTFNPNANGPVRALALQADGRVVVGGDFTALQPGAAAITRNRLARLDANGGVDASFNPNLGGALQPQVHALLIQADGRIVVGGTFTTVQPNGAAAAVTRNRLARFNADGSLDATFDPNPNSIVLALVQHVDGKVVVAGGFTSFKEAGRTASTTRNGIARLNRDGTLDTEFNPNANNGVTALVVQRDGKIVLGGYFTTLQPTTDTSPANRQGIGRLNPDGTLDSEFYPSVNGSVSSLGLQPDGSLVVGGAFTAAWGRGATSVLRSYVARFAPDGTLDATFNPGLNAQVNAISVQADGAVVLGGNFTRAQPAGSPTALLRNRVARLNADGSLDASLQLQATGRILTSVVQADGKVVVGGSFTTLSGAKHNYLGRLNADGSADATYNPDLNGRVYTSALQSDGKVIIGGAFTTIGGETRNRIARMNPIGTIDSEFNPNLDGDVGVVALQSDGKILVGGAFTTVQPIGDAATTSRTYLLRLNANGTLDTTFNPAPNAAVAAIAVQSDGKILIGGSFTALSPNAATTSTNRNYIARLNADGTLDSAFVPVLNARPSAIVMQSDGKVIVGGSFTSVLGTNATTAETRNHLARFNADGTVDTTYNPNANNPVLTLALQSDGKLLVGGQFTTFQPGTETNWTLRKYAARLNSDGTVDSSFNLDVNELYGNRVDSLRVLASGQILIGGSFASLQPAGTARVARPGFARLAASGAVDAAFNPGSGGAAGGQVNAFAVQADNKVIVVGSFTDLGGSPTANVARFTPEGAADTAFASSLNADGPVNAVALRATDPLVTSQAAGLAWLNRDGTLRGGFAPGSNVRLSGRVLTTLVQSGGRLVVGGAFSNLTNATAGNLVRFAANGTLDTSFNPAPNGAVTAILEQADGKLVVVGAFTTIGGSSRNQIARLNADGTLDASYDPNANGRINAAVLESAGTVLIGGAFTTLTPNGTTTAVTRNYLARIKADGTVDDYNPSPNLNVNAIVRQADGKAVIGGAFTTIQPGGGTTFNRSYLARLNTDGSLDQNFDPNANAPVAALAALPNGQFVVGGSFTTLQPGVTGTVFTRNYVARINSDGAVDLAFNPNANAAVTVAAVQPDGTTLLGGSFTALQANGAAVAITRKGLARVATDGTLDLTFNPDFNGDVTGAAFVADGSILVTGAFTGLQPSGAILLGGNFATIGGVSARNLALVNGDGSVTATFLPNPNGVVTALATQADGRMIVGGAFTSLAGTTRNRLARFGTDGSLETAYNPNVGGPVSAVALQADGRLLVGGQFTTVGGQARTNLARLNTDGTVDASFNAAVGAVSGLALQPDGKVLVLAVSGTAPALVRLNANGSVDPAFTSAAATGGSIASFAPQADGRIVVGGSFTSLGGTARARLARLNANGSVDTSFDPGANGAVTAVALQPDGRVLVGGSFNTVAGQSRVGLARLAASGPATQALTVSADRRGVTWVRGGTAGEVSAVIFELSSDRATWTRLGTGTRAAGTPNWQLTNLLLPPASTFYVRARGVTPNGGNSSGVFQLVREFNFANPITGTATTTIATSLPAETSPATAASLSVQTFTFDNVTGLEALRLVQNQPANGAAGTVEIVVDGASALLRPGTVALSNLSTRGRISAGRPLVVGFVISGDAPRAVLVRGVGPALQAFGLSDAVTATRLLVSDGSGRPVASVEGWASPAGVAAAIAQTGAFPLPARSGDSAALLTLAPGNYSLQVEAVGTTGGIALAEVYDAGGSAAGSRLVNVSSRGDAGVGADALISGFVVAGDGAQRLLLRGAGPALAQFGLSGFNADPVLALFDAQGRQLGSNDNWINVADVAAATAGAGAFSFLPGSRDAAVIATVPAGAYTVQVTGSGGSAGTALLEVYELR